MVRIIWWRWGLWDHDYDNDDSSRRFSSSALELVALAPSSSSTRCWRGWSRSSTLATYDHFRQHHQCDYFRRELSPTWWDDVQEKTLDVYGHVTCLRAQRNYMVGLICSWPGKLENIHHDKEDKWPHYIEVHFAYIDLLGSNWGSIHLYPRRPIRGEHILSILVKKKSHGQFKDCRISHPTL